MTAPDPAEAQARIDELVAQIEEERTKPVVSQQAPVRPDLVRLRRDDDLSIPELETACQGFMYAIVDADSPTVLGPAIQGLIDALTLPAEESPDELG